VNLYMIGESSGRIWLACNCGCVTGWHWRLATETERRQIEHGSGSIDVGLRRGVHRTKKQASGDSGVTDHTQTGVRPE
jgi:hypothetical protein